MTIEENKRIAHQAFEALVNRDFTQIGDLLAPDAVLHQCGFLAPIPARAILGGEFPIGSRIADRHVRLERMIAEGDIVALHWRTEGRFTDPDSPEQDGRHVSFPSMSFIRLENGEIVEIWNIQDRDTMRSQLDQAIAVT